MEGRSEMLESIWQALRDAGITLPEGTERVAITAPDGHEIVAVVPPDLLSPKP